MSDMLRILRNCQSKYNTLEDENLDTWYISYKS